MFYGVNSHRSNRYHVVEQRHTLWLFWSCDVTFGVSVCFFYDIISVLFCFFRPQLAYLLSQFQYFVCPVGFNSETISFTVECEPSEIFVMQEYTLPAVLQNTLRWVRASPSAESVQTVMARSV